MSVSKLPSACSETASQQQSSESVCQVCEGPLTLDEDGLFAHKELCFECFERERF